jgi:hypothetical protein
MMGSRSAVLLALVLGCVPVRGGAQDVKLKVYHGGAGESRLLVVEDHRGERSTSRSSLGVAVRPGSEVCVEVENAHPVLYRYDLGQSVDTAQHRAPDMSVVLGLLNAGLGAPAAAEKLPLDPHDVVALIPERAPAWVAPAPREPDSTWAQRAAVRIDALAGDLRALSEAIRKSDLPEALPSSVRGGPSDTGWGYGSVRRAMDAIPQAPFRFNDPDLMGRIAELRKTVGDSLTGTDTATARLTRELFVQRLEALAAQRDALRKAYAPHNGSWSACRKAQDGVNTLSLSVEARDTTLAKHRDTGASVISITAETEYSRPSLEVIPIGLAVRRGSVARASVVDSTLTLTSEQDVTPRIGTAVVLNAVRWGERREISLGPLLGVGVGAEGSVLSDFYVGAAFAIRDWFVVGAAWGQSLTPHRLKDPTRLGTRAEGLGDLSELVESGFRDAVYVVFSLKGLSLLERP